MKNHILILILCVFTTIACKTASSNSELETLKTQSMKLHDEVMPNTMKISEIKKQVLEKSDTGDASAKDIAQNINAKLQNAEDLMYKWMDDLGTVMNKKTDEAAELKSYKELVASVGKIKADTDAALKEADVFIKDTKK